MRRLLTVSGLAFTVACGGNSTVTTPTPIGVRATLITDTVTLQDGRYYQVTTTTPSTRYWLTPELELVAEQPSTYVTTLVTDSTNKILPYTQVGNEYWYLESTYFGKVDGNLILDVGQSIAPATIPLGLSVPPNATVVTLNAVLSAQEAAYASFARPGFGGAVIAVVGGAQNNAGLVFDYAVPATRGIVYQVSSATAQLSVHVDGFKL